MGIISENRAEYVITELACMAGSITIVPLPSKPSDLYNNTKFIIDQAQLDTICVSYSN